MDGFIDVQNVEIAAVDLSTLTQGGNSQNLLGVVNVGNNRLKFDGQNGRIVTSDTDGTPRVVIGDV